MRTRHFFILAAMAAAAASSCTEDWTEKNTSGKELELTVEDANATRTAYSGYTTQFESGDKIGLYVVKGTRIINANVPYTYDGTSWTASQTVEYNSGYTYYAYYPYTASPYTPDVTTTGVDNVFAAFITDSSNKFHAADQSTKAKFAACDLMAAQGTHGTGNTVAFSMYHKKGLAVFTGDGAADAAFTGNVPYLVSGTQYFLMKPETETAFTDDEGTYKMTASSGKYVTHSIAEAYNTYDLTVGTPENVTYSGGTGKVYFWSTRWNKAKTKSKAAPWTVTYSVDGGSTFTATKPAWLTACTASGTGKQVESTATTPGASDETISYTAAAQSISTATGTASSFLKAATAVTDYDLSTNGGTATRSTANCYLVHAPGTYKLPLVYGNAIKNGSTNTTAFYPNVSSNALARFINHAGTGITDPWLKNNSATPATAQLIWQDVSGLTADYAVSGDYLTFSVPAANIAEGNAVIAVKDASGNILWSWHIWVTNETLENTSAVATGSHTYTVAPVNIGWTNSGNITQTGYAARSCVVKITQTGTGGLEKTFTVTQTGKYSYTFSKQGTAPYYQWGRKDPFVPASSYSSTTGKTVYVGSGVASAGWQYEASTSATIGTNIQNPWKHYYNSSTAGPVSTTYYNMWDAKNTTTGNVTTATVKTVYDPCPPGFCVPTGNLYYYIGNGGSRTMSTWDSTNKGATWSTNTTGDALWFPAAGARSNSSGSLNYVGSYGYVWSASPGSGSGGRGLDFYSGYWYWNYCGRADGFAVRPVSEE